jgi:hypothetical protein
MTATSIRIHDVEKITARVDFFGPTSERRGFATVDLSFGDDAPTVCLFLHDEDLALRLVNAINAAHTPKAREAA